MIRTLSEVMQKSWQNQFTARSLLDCRPAGRTGDTLKSGDSQGSNCTVLMLWTQERAKAKPSSSFAQCVAVLPGISSLMRLPRPSVPSGTFFALSELTATPSLKCLAVDLSGNRLGKDDVETLAGLKRAKGLQSLSLDLSINGLSEGHAEVCAMRDA